MFATILLAAAIAVYLLVGVLITRRAMDHARAHALEDETYFVMSIQDGDKKPSLSILLPQITTILFWPLMLAIAFVMARAEPYVDDMVSAA